MPTTAQFISDDRCSKALKPLVTEGANELKTFIVCTSLFESSNWHLPKVGHTTLNLTVQDGNIIEGTITFAAETFAVESIDSGLTGNCVALIIKKGGRSVKLYLNIPLETGANPALSALREMCKGNYLEDVTLWLKRL